MRGAMTLALLCGMAAGQVRLPQYQRKQLANGVTVLTVSKPDVPLVTLMAIARGGQESETPGKAGLSALAAALMLRGAGSRNSDEYAIELDKIGATIRADADEQSVSLRMEVLKRESAAGFDLFADAISSPRFDEAEVRKFVGRRVDEARALKDNPGLANEAYFRPFYFGVRHPYGRPPRGDEISLARVGRADVVAHHAKAFAGSNLTVIAAGDLDLQALERLETRLAGTPAGSRHQWLTEPPAPVRTQPRLLLVDKADATQTYFTIGLPGIHRTHPDRTVLSLVNTLFGDRFTSMLNDELRVNSGLTYGARSDLQLDRLPGVIAIRTYTKVETTVQAIDLALEVLNRLRTSGIDAAQLASAKAYVKGGFPTRQLETAAQVAAKLGEIETFGLNRGEVDDLFSRIDAVTVEQANAAIRKHFTAGALQFCVTGPAAKIRGQLGKYAANRKEVAITAPGVVTPEF
jgi:predicted Zn-dependent peptidase